MYFKHFQKIESKLIPQGGRQSFENKIWKTTISKHRFLPHG
jgi:hypothetical protein